MLGSGQCAKNRYFLAKSLPHHSFSNRFALAFEDQMKITDTQLVIVKHTDKNHLHLHILANLVNNKGETIKDNWIGLRGKKVAQG